MIDVWDVLRDRLDPPNPDVFGILGYQPDPAQTVFHEATEFDVGFGGRAGCGKSKALVMEGLRVAMRYPGIEIGGFRRTYGELRESFIRELASVDFARSLGTSWNGSEHELRFRNGSIIRLTYAETITDATRRQGGQYQMMMFDERQLVHPDVPEFLISRIRTGNASVPVIGVRSTFNPGGLGHTYNKIRYIEATNYGHDTYEEQDFNGEPTGHRIRFVQGIPSKHLNADYWRQLAAIGDERRRRQFLEGDWETPEGAMFSQFRRSTHVCTPTDRPLHLPSIVKAVGVDWGRSAPFAALWIAKPADDIFVVYRELYQKELTRDEQADLILASEQPIEINPRHIPVYLDPACWARDADSVKRAGAAPARSTASIYSSHGLPVIKADNRRIEGWQLIHDLLAVDREGIPRLMIYDTCPQLIRTLQDLPRDIRNPEDVDTTADDHLADCLRYGLMGLMYKRNQTGDGRSKPLPKPVSAGIRSKVF